ncbi:hypothetical protein, partial [Staphylococcus epidermidis]
DYINSTIHLRSTMTKSANKIISIAIKDMKHIQNVLNRLLQISAKIKNIPFSKMVKILISTSTK